MSEKREIKMHCPPACRPALALRVRAQGSGSTFAWQVLGAVAARAHAVAAARGENRTAGPPEIVKGHYLNRMVGALAGGDTAPFTPVAVLLFSSCSTLLLPWTEAAPLAGDATARSAAASPRPQALHPGASFLRLPIPRQYHVSAHPPPTPLPALCPLLILRCEITIFLRGRPPRRGGRARWGRSFRAARWRSMTAFCTCIWGALGPLVSNGAPGGCFPGGLPRLHLPGPVALAPNAPALLCPRQTACLAATYRDFRDVLCSHARRGGAGGVKECRGCDASQLEAQQR